MNLRSLLYALARGLGDARAGSRGPRAIEKQVQQPPGGSLYGGLIRAFVR